MNTKRLRSELKKVTDPLGRKIGVASRQEIHKLRKWVPLILKELGHPEAYITDLSEVGDFRYRKSKLCGIPVTWQTRLISIARKLSKRPAKKAKS